jgi:hypothetical protein
MYVLKRSYWRPKCTDIFVRYKRDHINHGTKFETSYLLSSNRSIDKNFQFSPQFKLKVTSSVFRN